MYVIYSRCQCRDKSGNSNKVLVSGRYRNIPLVIPDRKGTKREIPFSLQPFNGRRLKLRISLARLPQRQAVP